VLLAGALGFSISCFSARTSARVVRSLVDLPDCTNFFVRSL
jgi:hypothetical protein